MTTTIAAPVPAVGTVITFATAPAFAEVTQGPTGRYAALQVLLQQEGDFLFAFLDGIWSEPPGLREVQACTALRRRSFGVIEKPALFWMYNAFWQPSTLSEASVLGTLAITPEVQAWIEDLQRPYDPGDVRASLQRHMASHHLMMHAVAAVPETEWRWVHDHSALLAEREAMLAKNAAIAAAARARLENRLKHLTWDKLLAEQPFAHWFERQPVFPPEPFILAARGALRQAVRELQALGPKPKKVAVRGVLKRCVQWFNAANGEHGQIIETDERESICEVLEELAFVAGHPRLADEIDQWRDW
jgi:hypothetical protein